MVVKPADRGLSSRLQWYPSRRFHRHPVPSLPVPNNICGFSPRPATTTLRTRSWLFLFSSSLSETSSRQFPRPASSIADNTISNILAVRCYSTSNTVCEREKIAWGRHSTRELLGGIWKGKNKERTRSSLQFLDKFKWCFASVSQLHRKEWVRDRFSFWVSGSELIRALDATRMKEGRLFACSYDIKMLSALKWDLTFWDEQRNSLRAAL